MSSQNDEINRRHDLSDAKRALLEKRLGGRTRRTGTQGIRRIADTSRIPLSFAQEPLWFLHQLDPLSPAYNMYNVVRLQGVVDNDLLEKCFQVLIERHDVFRTCFVTDNEQPIQKVAASVSFNIPVVELEASNPQERQQEAQQLIETEIRQPFDLNHSPLFRVLLVKQSDTEHILVLTIHHIIFDEWSNEIFWNEFSQVYKALLKGEQPDLPDLEIQYTDYSNWQKNQVNQLMAEQLAYWMEELNGDLPFIELPVDHPRPVKQAFRGAFIWRELPPNIYTKLLSLNQELGTTMFMSLMAAYQVLLSRFSSQNDILVGTPIANRTRNETKGLVGFFLNTLVIRGDLSENIPFTEFASQIRNKALSAYSNQDLPFEKLVDELHPNRNVSHNPIFQVMFVHQKSALEMIQLPGLITDDVPIDIGVSKFDLTMFVQESGGQLSIGLEYNTDLFEEDTAIRILDCYRTLIESILQNPQQPIAKLQILPEAERSKILYEWNDTGAGPVPDTCIHSLIEDQCDTRSNEIAVTDLNSKLSYGQLNKQANQLANYLQRHGVGANVPVGILLGRSTRMALSILAVLKAGGAYLPLDPAYPWERLAYMLDDSKAPVLITTGDLAGNLQAFEGKLIILDDDWSQISQEDESNLGASTSPGNSAYIIYTSGSTGKPRGVAVSHSNLVHSTVARNYFYDEAPEAFLLLSSFTFDSSIAGIFWTLCTGGILVLPPQRIEQDMKQLAEIIAAQKITHTLCLPSLYMLLLELAEPSKLLSLHTVIVAGEASQPELVQLHFERLSRAGLYNEYGPTEATVWSTALQIEARHSYQRVPIGRPIPNTQNYILDRGHQPVPVGVPGELCIGGPGLTAGYLNDPQTTARKFIEISLGGDKSTRIYRTGDRARYLLDGNIEYLGRVDQQVKIRGNRVELGEIESVIRLIPGVKDSVVSVKANHLAAYVILESPEKQPPDWREFLSDYLADYMVPNSYTILEEFPHTPNGKVDRNALPEPHALARVDEIVAPSSETEKVLAEIWMDVLGIDQVGIHDDFFSVGGNSLLSIRVFGRIADQFDVKMPLSVLFTETTLERLAARIDREEHYDDWSLIVPIQPDGEKTPFFCIHGLTGDILWFRQLGQLMAPDQPFYGIQAQGLDGKTPAIDNINEMASTYLHEIRKIQPNGPYILGGASLGGTVALEMAQQLENQGEDVALLIMFDHAPDFVDDNYAGTKSIPAKGVHLVTNSIQWAQSMRELGSGPVVQRVYRKARIGLKKFNVKLQQDSNNVDAADLLDYGSDLPDFRKRMIETHWHTINSYQASAYHKPVLLLQAKSQPLMSTEKPEDTWVHLATGQINIINIPGSHEGMFHEPHVHTLARELRSQLELAQTIHPLL